jgi:hypothetical protein
MLRGATNPNVRFHSKALPFIQTQIGNINAFFLRNDSDTMQHLDAELEVKGPPEFWDPWTSQTATIGGSRRQGGWILVEFDLKPFSSALIVFDSDGATTPASAVSAPRRLKHTEEIGAGGWKLTATGMVSSGKTTTIHRDLPILIDWSLDSELRGFSGRGTYSTTFTISTADVGKRLTLDLGNVRDVAEVKLNGKLAATLLLRPYQTDIGEFVQPGQNLLEISVTNALFNSMVLREPRSFHAGNTENASGLMSSSLMSSGLMSSGLIGPVQIKVMD